EAAMGGGQGAPRPAPRARKPASRARRAARRIAVTRSWWLVGVTLLACDPTTRVGAVADALSHRADADVRGTEAHWRRLLAEYLVRAETQCLPPVEQVLSPPAGSFAPRRIAGELPHYDVF